MRRCIRRIIKRNGSRKAPFAFPAPDEETAKEENALRARILEVMDGLTRDNKLFNMAETVEQEGETELPVLRMPYRSFYPAPGVDGHMDAETVGQMVHWMNRRGLLHRVGRHTNPFELRYMAIDMMAGESRPELMYMDYDQLIKVDNDGRGEEQCWFCLQPFWGTRLWDLACALAQRLDNEGVMVYYLENEVEIAKEDLREWKNDDPSQYRAMMKEEWNRKWFHSVLKSMKEPKDLLVEINKCELSGELAERLRYIEENCRNVQMDDPLPEQFGYGNPLHPDQYIHPIIWGKGARSITANVEQRINEYMGNMWFYYDVEITRVRDGHLVTTDDQDNYAERTRIRIHTDACLNLMQELLSKEEQQAKNELEQSKRLTSILR